MRTQGPQDQDAKASAQQERVLRNTSKMETYIDDIEFPCDKEDLLDHARRNGAPDDVMQLLRHFPDKQYASPVDISRGVKNAMH